MKSGRNEELDNVLVNLFAQADSSPNWQIAMQYRKIYSAAGTQKAEIKTKNALKFQTQSFKDYGSGVMLYFSLLEMLFYVFLLIALISLPSILSNLKGNGLEMFGGDSLTKTLMKASIANQRYVQFEKVNTDPSVYLDIRVSHAIIIFCDILGSIAFLFFLILWRIKSDEIVERQIQQDALPSYYTLIARKLPEQYSQKSLKEHFEQLGGEVAQIATVYNYENILNEIKLLLGLVDEYSGAKMDKRQALYEQICQKYYLIKEISKKKNPKPVMAIITFEDMIIRKKIRDLYKYEICPRQLKYNGKLIKVSNCKIEPSSILWENFHLKLTTEIRQGIFIYLLLIFILLAALVALFLVNARSTNTRQNQQKFTENIDYSKQYTYDEAKSDGRLQIVFNFCSKLNYQTSLLDYREFCMPYFQSYELQLGGTLLVALLVVTINILCNWIIYELANYRRYKTKTEKSRFLILNIFILYFINSALLIMFIRLQIDGYSLGKLITSIFNLPAEQFSIQAYSDFNRKWYMNIASQILMIHALSLILSPFIQILIGWIQSKIREFLAKRAKTQKEMNETLKDSEFDYQTFYAMILNSCFFTMFYGNALPLLYILAAIAFFSLYVASFIVFKYFSCKPMMFDHSLNIVISKVMCIALVVHQITSILYFYTQDIFPLTIMRDAQNRQLVYYGNKFTNGIVFIVLACLFAVFGINYSRACKMAKNVYNKYIIPIEDIEYNGKGVKKAPKLFREVFGQKSQSYQNYSYLSSYKMETNPAYLDICYTMTILKMFQPYVDCNHSLNDIIQERICHNHLEIDNQVLNQDCHQLQQMKQKDRTISNYYGSSKNTATIQEEQIAETGRPFINTADYEIDKNFTEQI